MTHTFATLPVPSSVFNYVRDALKAAAYDHAFIDDKIIDMHGIALVDVADKPDLSTRLRVHHLRANVPRDVFERDLNSLPGEVVSITYVPAKDCSGADGFGLYVVVTR